ncbi:MAG TPA: hypothetical protein EYP29_00775 [Thermoplasmata archaeon]|nr:hypothetical protein [Thermoplasmata archaeon]
MRNAVVLLSFLIVFAFLFQVAVEMRDFGKPYREEIPQKDDEGKYNYMDDYMTDKGQEETGTNNIVTAIVFDYRGFDTLGEATVLFTAVSGIFMLFRRKTKTKEEEKEGEE